MVIFNEWFEAFIFIGVFSVIIIIPCIIIAKIGKGLIDQLGLHPSNAPIIHLSIIYKLLITEIFSFSALIVFLAYFS